MFLEKEKAIENMERSLKIVVEALKKVEAVDHPDHYAKGRKYEPKDVIRDWRLNFNLGSAVKYIARAGRKNDIIEDLEKAIKYLEFEIEALREDGTDGQKR